MKYLQQYSIPYTGLKHGKHQFEFDVDQRFFQEFEYSLVKDGKLHVKLELEKQETMLILLFDILGYVNLTCDVCLAEYPHQMNIQERQIAKFSEEELNDNSEEIIVLNRNDHVIDVSGLIYEFITLSVPFVNRCDDEGNNSFCDKEMIEQLNKLSVKVQEEEPQADPRWEALNKIKKDNN